ncbi:MAG TPA: NAD(P)H-hydrate epimerase, partial [Nitrososphaeraceae archaeon]|nr:NAD(P)H-hydrate epimerase [Nitrososphaeraceae archaeon]
EEQPITSEQMYSIEDNGYAIFGMKKLLMMENAGHGLADFVVSEKGPSLAGKKIISLCGTGNNGGDAMVASRHLSAQNGIEVTVVLLGDTKNIKTEETTINWSIIQKMNSIEILTGPHVLELAKNKISDSDIIIDGIFGTGIKGEIREPFSSAIDLINASNAYVVAVDIPSGLNPNYGTFHQKCVKANATVTFHRIKKGLTAKKDYTGKVHLEKIGIPIEAEQGVV